MSIVTKALAKYNVDLPRYFRIISKPLKDVTQVALLVNVKGTLKEIDRELPKAPTLLDVVALFPSVDLDEFPAIARTIIGAVSLPRSWTLEFGPAEGGFLLTLDIHKGGTTKRWEKKLNVSAPQLKDLLDVVNWVKESNQVDRFGAKP